MRFCQRTIKLESTLREGFGFRISLAGGRANVIFQQQVAVGESNISERVVRIFVGCLLKLIERLLEILRSPLLPVITTFQIELVGFWICCIAFNKALLLFAR